MKIRKSMLLCAWGMSAVIGMTGCGRKEETRPGGEQSGESQPGGEQSEESRPGGEQSEESQPGGEQEFLSQVKFSYLADEDTQELVRRAMSGAGISEARQEIFFSHVDQFNSMAKEYLTEEVQTAETEKLPLYDPYVLQDAWNMAYPNLYGYNCRITAYSLLADLIRVDESAQKQDEYLVFDLLALDSDPDVFADEQERERFRVLFSAVLTESTQDWKVHEEKIREAWRERGISFENGTGASLITVFLHDQLGEEESELIIGHAGVLLEQEDGGLLFIEKVAFQEPYQAVFLANRTELNDYLMGKYDISYGQETARPIVFENDRLLEGYRFNPHNAETDLGQDG